MLPGLLGYQLRLAQQAVFRDFERAMQGLDLSPGRVGMLVLIDANPGLTQSRLAQAIGLDGSTLVPLLDELERRALIERQRGADRRTNGLSLTATGRKFLGRVAKRVAEHEKRIARVLDGVERATLLDYLTRLAGGRI